MCLDSLDSALIGVLKKHHQFFNFKSEEGIDYLALHVEYVHLSLSYHMFVLLCGEEKHYCHCHFKMYNNPVICIRTLYHYIYTLIINT